MALQLVRIQSRRTPMESIAHADRASISSGGVVSLGTGCAAFPLADRCQFIPKSSKCSSVEGLTKFGRGNPGGAEFWNGGVFHV